jgi:hypothetical protein
MDCEPSCDKAIWQQSLVQTYPFQGKPLIKESRILLIEWDVWGVREAEYVEAIIGSHHDNIVIDG